MFAWQETFDWVKDVLGSLVSDANRIASENPWFLVVILALLVAFVIYPAGRVTWFWVQFAWHRLAHWGRRTVGKRIHNYQAREFFTDSVVELINYMWLRKMINRKQKNRLFRECANAFDEPDFLPLKPAKPLSKDAQDHQKKLSRERREQNIGPIGQLPGDKPIQDPETKRGKVVVV